MITSFHVGFLDATRNTNIRRGGTRARELSHDPPFVADEPSIELTTCKPSASPEKKHKVYDVYNYNCALVTYAMLFFNFLDAIREGDGERVMRQCKYFLLYCRADDSHSTKYALEMLYQFFLVHALLSERDRERFVWNRFVNNHGEKRVNMPLDEARQDIKRSNNYVKQGIRTLGPICQSPQFRECAKQRMQRHQCWTNLMAV